MNFLLKNISWNNDRWQTTSSVRIKDGVITEIGNDVTPQRNEISLDFKDHFLYPGLINAHDHLDMNLYPQMGKPPYQNYTEWAKDIYQPRESPVKEIEGVAIEDRLVWGGVKNLISGVTSVVHHNPWHRVLSKSKFPVRTIETAWAHSLGFEKDVSRKFPKKEMPFVIHAAEGIDEFAQKEIKKLNDLGLLKPNTVLIHAVGLSPVGIELLKQAKSSVVWCPASNLFMFGKTLPLKEIIDKVNIALGSDSTMTGSMSLLDEMRVAEDSGLASIQDIYKMVTSIPARIFQLEAPEIKVGRRADFCIAPKDSDDYFENIIKMESSKIGGVFIGGDLRYGDFPLANALKAKGFQVEIHGREKWCAYDVRSLKKRIETKTKGACGQNLLWNMVS